MINPRAITKEEARKMLLKQFAALVNYWSQQEGTTQSKMSGLVFSMLNVFDGTSLEMPAFNITPSPHPDDKQFMIDQGENWFDSSVCINDDCCLHEEWHAVEKEILIQDQVRHVSGRSQRQKR